MTSRNTLIIGAFGQFPYAESVGDVNIPYCKLEDNPACHYDPSENTYAPGEQLKTLKLSFSKFEAEVIDTVKGTDKAIPLISVLFSGRPLLVQDVFATSDAMIAAWLPGTSGGQGIVDSIIGNYNFRTSSPAANTLTFDWPRDMVTMFSYLGIFKQFPSLRQRRSCSPNFGPIV